MYCNVSAEGAAQEGMRAWRRGRRPMMHVAQSKRVPMRCSLGGRPHLRRRAEVLLPGEVEVAGLA